MCHLLWMFGILLIVPGFRTAAETLKDATPKKGELKCYSCAEYEDDFSLVRCGDKDGVVVVTCPVERPVCWTVANATVHDILIGCGPDTGKAKSFVFEQDPILKSDLSLIYQCTEPKCNRPIDSSFFLEAIKTVRFKYNQNLTIEQIFQNFTNIDTAPIDQVLVNTSNMKFAEIKHRSKPTEVPSTSSKPTNSTSTIGNPQAEPLKQDPIASEDDEDDGEGSGASEDYKNKRLASSPSDPSSYLPAKENKATRYTARNIVVVAVLNILVFLDM